MTYKVGFYIIGCHSLFVDVTHTFAEMTVHCIGIANCFLLNEGMLRLIIKLNIRLYRKEHISRKKATCFINKNVIGLLILYCKHNGYLVLNLNYVFRLEKPKMQKKM